MLRYNIKLPGIKAIFENVFSFNCDCFVFQYGQCDGADGFVRTPRVYPRLLLRAGRSPRRRCHHALIRHR